MSSPSKFFPERAGNTEQPDSETPAAETAQMASAPTHLTWIDKLYRFRDRLMASPRFQRWASSFPLTRPVSQKHTGALYDLCAGFVYSQILMACIQLRLFERLWEGPQTLGSLARQCNLPEDAMRRLLDGGAALGLLSRRSGKRYGLGMLGAAVYSNPGIAAMVEHHKLLYEDLRDPVALLRHPDKNTALSQYWPYTENDSAGKLDRGSVCDYTALMSASQELIADDILSAYNFGKHRRLLDIGGGDGTFLTKAAAAYPSLQLMLFDLPAVAERASDRFAEDALTERAKTFGGDFLNDPLPEGGDIVTLIRILFDHDDLTVKRILQAVRRVLPPNGVLIIAETMSGISGTNRISDAYFSFYLLAMGHGRTRSLDEFEVLLKEAGFAKPRIIPSRRPLLTNLLAVHPRKD